VSRAAIDALSLISGVWTRLSNPESDSMYQGPAGYINILGAGDCDDPEAFRLYVGQSHRSEGTLRATR